MGVRSEKKTAGKAPFGRAAFLSALRRFRLCTLFCPARFGRKSSCTLLDSSPCRTTQTESIYAPVREATLFWQ
jgi:hypothetical protein